MRRMRVPLPLRAVVKVDEASRFGFRRSRGDGRRADAAIRERTGGRVRALFAVVVALIALLASGPVRPAGRTHTDNPGPSSHPPRRLATRIEAALAAAPPGATVGVAVLSGRTGETLYARNADRLLIPASNAKVFVLGAALSRLGPGATFRTEALAAGPIDGGALRGPLVLRGSGDPSLTSEGLWGIALDLEAAGLRRVEGDLILDATAFAPDQPPAAGPGRNEARPYGAVTSALTVNFNTLALEVGSASRSGGATRVVLVPPMGTVTLESGVRTAPAGSMSGPLEVAVSAPRQGGSLRVRVTGRVAVGEPPRRIWKAVEDPVPFAGALFKETLSRADIAIAGKSRIGPAPPGARVIASRESAPLAVLAREVGKRSSNLFAEQILKALDPETARTTAGGLEAVRSWLAMQGLGSEAVRLVDGSGLSRSPGIRQAVRSSCRPSAWPASTEPSSEGWPICAAGCGGRRVTSPV